MAQNTGTAKGWAAALLALAGTGWLTGAALANQVQADRAIGGGRAEACEAGLRGQVGCVQAADRVNSTPPSKSATHIRALNAGFLDAHEAVRTLLEPFEPNPPRIYVVDPATLTTGPIKPNTAAFRRWYGDRVDPNVYINVHSVTYKRAMAGERVATMALAAMIAHEIAHERTKGEGEPCRRELVVLERFLQYPGLTADDVSALLERMQTVRQYGAIK